MNNSDLSLDKILEMIYCALKELYQKDTHFFFHDGNKIIPAHERSFVFRFGIYFNDLLKKNYSKLFLEDSDIKLSLDSEYNRNLGHLKTLTKTNTTTPRGYCPDLLIHSRGNNNSNLVFMEFKMWTHKSLIRNIDKDKNKASSFCEDPIYKYEYGIVVLLGPTIDKVQIEYYIPKRVDPTEGEWKRYSLDS